MHLKRALLEVISAGVASTQEDINNFFKCTLLSAQKQFDENTVDENSESKDSESALRQTLDFLIEYEFVRLQKNEDTKAQSFVATLLGNACLASSMPPSDGLILFAELQKARRCFVLETELHAVYLVTPYSVCYQLNELDWLFYLDLWEKLSPPMRKVGELVGIKESFLVRAMRGHTNLDYKAMQIHKRFYTALALQELVNEVPINEVTKKYKCTRGMLQNLQQIASTFAGIVTAFCNSLQWSTLSLIVSQFKERLFFGIHRDLIDLMRLPDLSQKRARALFDSGITNLVELAHADMLEVEKILFNALSFDCAKQRDDENAYEAEKRNMNRIFFITGKSGLTVAEGAKFLVEEARKFVQYELGVDNINWVEKEEVNKSLKKSDSTEYKQQIHMSIEENYKLPKLMENVRATKTQTEVKEIEVGKEEYKLPKLMENVRATKTQTEVKEIEVRKEKTEKLNNKENEKPLQDISKSLLGKRKNEQFKSPIVPLKKSPEMSKAIATHSKLMAEMKKLEDDLQPRCDEYPSTSKEALKIIRLQRVAKLKKEAELKRTKSELTINAQNIKIEKQEPEHDNKFLKITNVAKTSTPSYANIRRSPRNHAITKPKEITVVDKDLFNSDDSFTIDSGITKALEKVETVKDKDNDEIPNSQELDTNPRLMQTLRRSQRFSTPSRPHKQMHQDGVSKSMAEGKSLELSDLSFESSLLKQPLLLNASHILSCSKQDNTAFHFKSLDIIDICGHAELFNKAQNEIISTKRLSFCLGLEKHTLERTKQIGAKLLLNTAKSNENETAKVSFQYDEHSYIAGCALGFGENTIYYVNLQDEGSEITAEKKCKLLLKLFSSSEHHIIICDAKEQLKILLKVFKDLIDISCNIEDPKVANWILEPDKILSFPQMTQQFAPECTGLVKLCGSGRGHISYGLDFESAIYAKVRCSVEACVSAHILQGQKENLERIGEGELYKFFKELEMPLQRSLCHMEFFGFPVSEKVLTKAFKQIVHSCKQIETRVFELHGSKFNFNSTASVAKVLGLQRKQNGKYSTSKQILEKMDSPIAQLIILHRKLSVTLSKTIQPLLKCIKNGRIHGQSITFTATGRISMVEPNLQNIAKDFVVDLGKEQILISCRDAFFPTDENNSLISADFCQLEMRILAHLSQDPTLLKVMSTEEDLFTAIAARWNRISEAEVSTEVRNGTKQICYGIVYGMGMRSLAEALKCTEDEARLLCEQFHATYPNIRIYTEKVIRFARNNGYVETITGRRRYLAHINSSESNIKGQAERQAVNSSIQGSAADIAKSAILRMEKNVVKYRQKLGLTTNNVRLVLHVHDELIFEVPTDKARKVAKVLSLTMENCVKLSVPLRVKLKAGRSWSQLKEIKM